MITHELKKCGSLVEAEVKWTFADKAKSVKNKFNDPLLAEGFVKVVERKVIVETITKYINHRLHMYTHDILNVTTMRKAESLAKIKLLKETLPALNLPGVCRTILIYKQDLMEVMPASRSKFYPHDSNILREIFNDCKLILESN